MPGGNKVYSFLEKTISYQMLDIIERNIFSLHKINVKSVLILIERFVYRLNKVVINDLNLKLYNGEFLIYSRNGNIKIFNFDDNTLVTFIGDTEHYNKMKNTYLYFREYFNIPILGFNDEERVIKEKFLIYVPVKRWSYHMKYQAVNAILMGHLKQVHSEYQQIDRFFIVHEKLKELKEVKGNQIIRLNKIINVIIPSNKVDDKWPAIMCHGDMNFSNVLLYKNEFFLIDWEDSDVCIFFYDIFCCIFAEFFHEDSSKPLEEYTNGSFDNILTKFFESVSSIYCNTDKIYYLTLFIIERILKYDIVRNINSLDAKIRGYIEILEASKIEEN